MIDYPYFANHGLLACADLAARPEAHVDVYDAFAQPGSGRLTERVRAIIAAELALALALALALMTLMGPTNWVGPAPHP